MKSFQMPTNTLHNADICFHLIMRTQFGSGFYLQTSFPLVSTVSGSMPNIDLWTMFVTDGFN